MKTILLATIVGALCIALPTAAAETAAQSAPIAVGERANQMTRDGGRFHRAHVTEAGLGCGTCHGRSDDVLLMRAPLSVGMPPRAAKRKACLVCHQAPATHPWYGPAK